MTAAETIQTPPPDDRARTTREWFGAFVLTPESLRAFESILRRFCARRPTSDDPDPLLYEVTVFSPSDGIANYQNTADVIALRNRKTSPILAVSLKATSQGGNARILIDGLGIGDSPGIRVKAAHTSPEAVAEIGSLVEDEARSIRSAYWWLRWPSDRFFSFLLHAPRRVRYPLVILSIVLGLLLLSPSVIDPWRISRWRDNAVEVIRSVDENKGTPVELDDATRAKLDEIRKGVENADQQVPRGWRGLAKVSMALAGYLFLGYFGPKAFRRLFPCVVFEIGEGKRRHEHLIWYRRMVLTTVLLGGLALPWIRSHWFGV